MTFIFFKTKKNERSKIITIQKYKKKMSYTKFSSAACGLTIVAHGEIQVYAGNHIKQCLEAACTGSENLHVFRKGLTDNLTSVTSATGTTAQFLASSECRELMSQIPDCVYESSATVPVGIHRKCCAPCFTSDELDLLDDATCSVSESWTVHHPITTGIMFTTIELYTIEDIIDDNGDDTSEQFTLVTTLMDPVSKPKNPTQIFCSGVSEMVINIGRRSDIKMYCHYCHDNVRTKICPCRKRRYCSTECQKADWNDCDHKYDHGHHNRDYSDKNKIKMEEVD